MQSVAFAQQAIRSYSSDSVIHLRFITIFSVLLLFAQVTLSILLCSSADPLLILLHRRVAVVPHDYV